MNDQRSTINDPVQEFLCGLQIWHACETDESETRTLYLQISNRNTMSDRSRSPSRSPPRGEDRYVPRKNSVEISESRICNFEPRFSLHAARFSTWSPRRRTYAVRLTHSLTHSQRAPTSIPGTVRVPVRRRPPRRIPRISRTTPRRSRRLSGGFRGRWMMRVCVMRLRTSTRTSAW